ncbi:hypothetical protein GFS31_31580 [Leptolyngbya sp. BL0902]|uniref:DUF2973 domain-containing protein n=1 Tax=Leptolyngbya sp. BL0902 TaxID=1115757 RepID=UPI0018E7E5B8|nr:DUF2973 domain-containing protein [Leptolyngbya sp. BL0902]QQE66460.1 hypothetical protein GFS31_31580 [Leptolyngbya sp. BL0902]
MWQIIYIIAFAFLAILAIANLVRNLVLLGNNARNSQAPNAYRNDASRPVPHPELLDQDGQVIREPLLVMRSISVKDAREQLDALYNSDDSDDVKPAS